MSPYENKGLVLGMLAGAAGLSFGLLWWKRHGNVIQENQATVMVLQGRQLQILEMLGNLLQTVEEIKAEVKFLKDTVPKLEAQIRNELRQKNEAHKVSPQHRVLKKKKSDINKKAVEYHSSEEAESEGGYLTANADTEVESEDEPGPTHINAEASKLAEEAAELHSFLQEADKSHSGSEAEKQEAFQMMCNNKMKFGNSVAFLWRLARAYSDMFYITSDNEEKKSYAKEGKIVAGKAVELDDSSAESHRWFAIMCGYVSEFDNVQDRIKNGYLFKEHLEKAIELNPQDPLQYYLMGRWCYAVSQLSWIERKIATALFGTPPTSTVQEALHNFLKAEDMQPGYSKFNYVFLAKCYKDLGQKATALKYCDDASAIASVTKEDKDAQKDLEVLIASLSP
ncbi:regulator of microtubule dynamics protein 2 [Pelodytes ibericus]